jgi:uncharacterized protein (AIM24 family)
MNPCEIELGVVGYLESAITIPANTQFLEAVSAGNMDLEKQAVVARAENVEYRGTTSFVATIEVAVRSPATVFSRANHSDLVKKVTTALQNKGAFVTAFNSATTGIDLIGVAPVNYRAPEFEDRSWINVVSVDCGIVQT